VPLASLISRGQAGLRAIQVTVEVHLAGGLPGFTVTGLPAAAVRESKDRVRAALQTCEFKVPVSRVTVHLGPADIPKVGGRFDLPIALGVIKAEQRLEWPIQRMEFLGELALNGDLKPIHGALPAVLAARAEGHSIVLPAANAAEAALVADVEAYGAKHLTEVVAHLNGTETYPVQRECLEVVVCFQEIIIRPGISRKRGGQRLSKNSRLSAELAPEIQRRRSAGTFEVLADPTQFCDGER
jgi:magnesium chelatase family protein